MKTDKRGFTLIELIVVIIIVGILAAIAVPMMANMKAKAICAEAVTTMGAIRNAMRAHSLEYSNRELYYHGWLVDDPLILSRLGIAAGGLQGVYFGEACYFMSYGPEIGEPGYVVCAATPARLSEGTPAPKADETLSITDNVLVGGGLRMEFETGRITQDGISSSGYPHFEE